MPVVTVELQSLVIPDREKLISMQNKMIDQTLSSCTTGKNEDQDKNQNATFKEINN